MHTDQSQMRGIHRMVSCGRVVSRRGRGLVLALLIGLLWFWQAGQAADFTCVVGDVACLIDAINTANANGEANTITLEADTYTLTAVDNITVGPNGLPAITSTLTIQGAGIDTTILERQASAPSFFLIHVAATGTLTLEGLTLRGGHGGLLNHGGTVAIAHTLFTGNTSPFGGGLYNDVGGTVDIAHALFIGNSTGSPGIGGGVFNGDHHQDHVRPQWRGFWRRS
jgi:hypothetical protein